MAFCAGPPVDGEPEAANSPTWAELFAIASALSFVSEFISFYLIGTTSLLQIWSDSAIYNGWLH